VFLKKNEGGLSFKTNALFLLKEKVEVFNLLIMRYLPECDSRN